MDINIYNENFILLGIIDSYQSLIWTDRFCEYGDFELKISKDNFYNYGFLSNNYYASIKESKAVMIIETIDIQPDDVTISGRSLESILDRRFNKYVIDTKDSVPIMYIFSCLIGNNMLKKETEDDLKRNIKFMNAAFSSNSILYTDPSVWKCTGPNFEKLSLSEQNYIKKYKSIKHSGIDPYDLFGISLGECFSILCQSSNLGYHIYEKFDSEGSIKMLLDIDIPSNLSESVIFSESFDNLINETEYESIKNSKNTSIVLFCYNPNNDPSAENEIVTFGSGSDLNRKEVWVDATDESAIDPDGNVITRENFINDILGTKSTLELLNHRESKTFDAEIFLSDDSAFQLNYDFKLGDIVTVKTSNGIMWNTQIDEIIISDDSEGLKTYANFTNI